MSEFRVGDRVRCIAAGIACREHKGKCGTVRVLSNHPYVGVEFDEVIIGRGGHIGHSLNGLLDNERGWNCAVGELELIVDETPCPVEDLL